MIFTVTATHTGRAVASLEYVPFLEGWICKPDWCDMSQRREPVDGYTFKAPGEYASAHREGLHEALWRLAEKGEYSISIRGLRYLRALADDPVLPPQPMRKELL